MHKKARYRRTYTWNERNQLVSSVDSNYNTAYVYGQDGQRTNKYTQSSETLYFNKMWTRHTDSGNSVYGGQTSKNIYLGETRIVTKLNSGSDPTYHEELYKQYFYHSDHLGSASLISDYKGDEYQRIEYTPYGETWVEKTQNTGLEFLPYKFTGKELDEETGLYYYGARYLDPKYSMWISTDPALGDYIPKAPINEEAKKHNQNLPGMGGVFNHINGDLYAYAGNNPVKYTDPDGNEHGIPSKVECIQAARASCTYGTPSEIRQLISDNKRTDSWGIYSIKGGTVAMIQSGKNQSGSYGNSIIIQNIDGNYTRYAHLESIGVELGDWVGEGEQIGRMGNTGSGIPGPNKHLHVSVYPNWAYSDVNGFRKENAVINPEEYIKGGTYPANTKISTHFMEMIGNEGYPHEGTDFSGKAQKLINGWQQGLKGKETIDDQK